MDVSTNKIDLEYLTNPCYTIKVPEKKKELLYCVSNEDLDFYKKRIFELTRKMLLGGKINTKINDAFHAWAKVSIEHFKFMDKKDIIQEDYKDIVDKKNNNASFFNLQETNKSFFKKQTHNDISDMFNIKRKSKQIFIPMKRDINLKTEKLKNKQIDKNLSNKYEDKKKKKKKKKKKHEGRKKKKKNCVKVEI